MILTIEGGARGVALPLIQSSLLICIFLFACVEKRKAEADKIRERYSDRIPVICEKSETSKLPDIDKTK